MIHERKLAGLLAVVAGSLMMGACATAPVEVAESGAKAKPESPHCLRETGTRLPPGEGRCIGPGRVVGVDEIHETGVIDLGEALNRVGAL